MALYSGNRRWPAGALLLLLATIFMVLGRRPTTRLEPAPVTAAIEAKSTPNLLPVAVVKAVTAQELPLVEILKLPTPPSPEIALPEPALQFDFPTKNTALLQSRPEQFFMFVDRATSTGQEQVWQGGDYGFVRNPRQTAQGMVFTKFHEGSDIAPFSRDPKGEPQDEVRAVADGTVGYVTASPRASNYGNYIVVLHQIGEAGVFYSLYAHLRSTEITVGSAVKRGQKLGMLGYTGEGIDRRRAHVHLEIGLILSEHFDAFYTKTSALPNGHGNFHGSNLIGFNAAAFLVAHHTNPRLLPQDFLRQQAVYYKVLVPNRGQDLALVQRYPWLRQVGTPKAAWEISFTGPGVPIAVAPAAQAVPFATVSWVQPFAGYHSWNTRSMLGGSGTTATLSKEGNHFLMLVTGDF